MSSGPEKGSLPVALADLTEVASLTRANGATLFELGGLSERVLSRRTGRERKRRSRPQGGRAPAGSGIIPIEKATNERTRPEQNGDENPINKGDEPNKASN